MNASCSSIPWLLYRNGRKIDHELSFEQIARRGLGIFETMRTYGGRIFQMEDHLKRLRDSARTCGYDVSRIDLSQVGRQLLSALKAYREEKGPEDVAVRLTLYEDSVFVMIGMRKHPDRLYEKGIALKTSPVRRSLSNASYPESKTTAYQNAVLASVEPRPEGIYEWLFVDREGYISEVRTGNIFLVEKPSSSLSGRITLLTPPTTGILNGLTRQFVIKYALRAGYEVRPCPLTRHELYNASESFLTNTSWEILPVVRVDGRLIGTGRPGRITQKLHRMFHPLAKKECRR